MKLTQHRMKWNGMWNGMSSCECGKLPNSFPTVTAKRYKMRRNKAKWLRACYILRQSARIHLATHGCTYIYGIYEYNFIFFLIYMHVLLLFPLASLPHSTYTQVARLRLFVWLECVYWSWHIIKLFIAL